jgi:erythromycin esterase-like protein
MHPTHARQAAALEALLSGGSVDECMPRIPAGRYAKGDGLVITIGSKDGRQTFRLERREQEIEVSLDEQGRPSFQVGPPVWQWGRPTFTLEPGGTLVENKANGTKVEFRLQQQQQAPSPAGAEARAPTRAPVRPPPSPEPKISPAAATAAVAAAAFPLSGGEADYEPLLRSLGEAQFVLLGESTHGTKEFYEHRAAITRRLVSEHGFNVVLVEGEWPAAHRIHRYIGADGGSSDRSAAEALESFEGFPRWMWRNGVTAELAEFLKDHNRQVDGERRDFESARDAKEEMSAAGLTVGQLEEMGILGDQELAEWARRRGRPDSKREVSFYGMDVYSVGASARAVVEFLEIVDPEAAERARGRYSVFNEYGTDMKAYGRDVLIGPLRPMAEEIQANLLSQLGELQRNNRDAYSFLIPPLELLNAEQNAEVVVNGEAYFRDLYTEGSVATWNRVPRERARTRARARCPSCRPPLLGARAAPLSLPFSLCSDRAAPSRVSPCLGGGAGSVCGLLLGSAGPAHGADVPAARRVPRPRRHGAKGRRMGAQLPLRRRERHGDRRAQRVEPRADVASDLWQRQHVHCGLWDARGHRNRRGRVGGAGRDV